jgi:hypothetical protein
MRLLKMLGLAMVAAAAVTAFLGAGTASAVLCKVNQSPCSAGNQYPVPTTILVKSSAVKLTGSINVLCESEATLKHEKTEGSKLLGTITALTWPHCTEGCSEATTTSVPPGTFDDEATGGGNGKLLALNVTVLLKGCPFGIECTAKAINGTTFLTLDGGAIGSTALGLASTEVSVSGGGGLCGTKGKWETEAGHPYVVTEVNGSKTGSIFQE